MNETQVPLVVAGMLALLIADEAFVELLGGEHLYERMTIDQIEQIPGVYWYVLPIVPSGEIAEDCKVRFDIWATGTDLAFAIENRIRRVLHSPLPLEVNTVDTWMQVVQSIDIGEGLQNDEARRVVEVTIQPLANL